MESYTGQQQFNGTDLVGWDNTVGGASIGNCWISYPQWYPFFEREIHHHYPSVCIQTEKSKVEQAFKILGKLMEKKIIKQVTVKEFIELVNEIASVL